MPNDSSGNSNTPSNVSAADAIELRNVSYNLPNGRSLLHDLSLTVKNGETLVLLGRSGAGKSTALKLINPMLELSGGEIRVEGKSAIDWDPIALRRHIGYVIQALGLFPAFTLAPKQFSRAAAGKMARGSHPRARCGTNDARRIGARKIPAAPPARARGWATP